MTGINSILVAKSKEITENGKFRFNERTHTEIKEIRNAVMIGDPLERYLLVNSRKNNLCAQVMEMMMVLSGNPDLRYLSMFLPRAVDYSDDGGLTWRGNYGIRIRGNNAFKGEQNGSYQFARYTKDNLARVIEELTNDPSSRQCFITIGDSNLDRFVSTKDTPCTMTLVYGTDSEGLLTATTFMRSNDLIFGFSGVNYFIFTCLQELIGSITKLPLGNYCHHSVSLHVYSDKYKVLSNLSNENSNQKELSIRLFDWVNDLPHFDKVASKYFEMIGNCFISVKVFYDNLIELGCGNELTTLLTGTQAYLYKAEGAREEFFSINGVKDSMVVNSGLYERDSFFNK